MPISSRNFEIGENVYAKWPGSNLYYKGRIDEYDADENEYKLTWESDGSTAEIPSKFVYKESQFGRSRSKSPARRRSRSTSRSRRRSKSPARSRKSPSPSPKRAVRKPRSPARKVSQKLIEASKTASVTVKRVSSERSAVHEDLKETETVEKTVTTVTRTPNLEVKGRSIKRLSPMQSINRSIEREEHETVTRRTTRSATRAAMQEEQSAVESKADAKKTPQCKVTCVLRGIISLVGHLLMMVMPLFFIYGLYLTCKKKTCTFTKVPKLPAANKFFNWKSLGVVFGWFGFQAILYVLPVGKIVSGPTLPNRSRLQYRLNGLLAFVINVACLAGIVYSGKLSAKHLNSHLSMVTASFILSLVVSSVVFLLARRSKEPSEGVAKDFVLGRMLHPRLKLFNFDIKMFAFNAGCISWGIMNLCYLLAKVNNLASLKSTLQTNPSIGLLVAFQTWYIIDMLVFQESVLYTATMTSTKVGYMFLSANFLAYPFFCSTQARYLSNHSFVWSWYCYVIPVVLQVVGYYIYRVSINQKFNFRKDQHKEKLAGVDYITTSNRKNILVDGWWKVLRHPNYLGDLLMNISWATLCGCQHPVPWVYPVLLLATLIYMSLQDDAKCKEKYGSSWQEYQSRVKYRMIPYIF